jgi:16S rRNA (guanine1207-N2)-methyltransferase
MTPPFHLGRTADPALGRAFITAAARVLAPSGSLWMVANRHLPYESTLAASFAKVEEIAGDTRFKVLHATRPARARR